MSRTSASQQMLRTLSLPRRAAPERVTVWPVWRRPSRREDGCRRVVEGGGGWSQWSLDGAPPPRPTRQRGRKDVFQEPQSSEGVDLLPSRSYRPNYYHVLSTVVIVLGKGMKEEGKNWMAQNNSTVRWFPGPGLHHLVGSATPHRTNLWQSVTTASTANFLRKEKAACTSSLGARRYAGIEFLS